MRARVEHWTTSTCDRSVPSLRLRSAPARAKQTRMLAGQGYAAPCLFVAPSFCLTFVIPMTPEARRLQAILLRTRPVAAAQHGIKPGEPARGQKPRDPPRARASAQAARPGTLLGAARWTGLRTGVLTRRNAVATGRRAAKTMSGQGFARFPGACPERSTFGKVEGGSLVTGDAGRNGSSSSTSVATCSSLPARARMRWIRSTPSGLAGTGRAGTRADGGVCEPRTLRVPFAAADEPGTRSAPASGERDGDAAPWRCHGNRSLT